MSRPLIWVIEDNDQNFELVDFLLGEAGYDVARARDSDELAPLLAGAPPRLVLLDMNLPSGSGLELLRHLRRDESSQRIPVVALTAHAMRGDRERFLAAGCDGYISKPIEADAFLAAVAAFVGADAEFPGDTRQP
jgi:two-component system, cell cycle response regulator DivK